MGLNAAVNAREAVEYLASALATELIALSNARFIETSTECHQRGNTARRDRAWSPVLREDRRLDTDIARLAAWIGRRPRRR